MAFIWVAHTNTRFGLGLVCLEVHVKSHCSFFTNCHGLFSILVSGVLDVEKRFLVDRDAHKYYFWYILTGKKSGKFFFKDGQ